MQTKPKTPVKVHGKVGVRHEESLTIKTKVPVTAVGVDMRIIPGATTQICIDTAFYVETDGESSHHKKSYYGQNAKKQPFIVRVFVDAIEITQESYTVS